MIRGIRRARLSAAPILILAASATGCILITAPIRILAALVTGVFRLGAAGVTALGNVVGSAAGAVGPYLLFWASADPAAAPGPDAILAAVREAGGLPDPVVDDPAEAIERRPRGAQGALVVPLRAALAPNAEESIASALAGRRLLGVSFVRPASPAGAPPFARDSRAPDERDEVRWVPVAGR